MAKYQFRVLGGQHQVKAAQQILEEAARIKAEGGKPTDYGITKQLLEDCSFRNCILYADVSETFEFVL